MSIEQDVHVISRYPPELNVEEMAHERAYGNYCDSGLFKRQLEALWGYIQKADPQKKREPETGLFDVVLYLFLWGSGLPVKVACVETSLFESMFILDRGVETQSAGVERST
jgi:hypothetical protein